MNSNIKNNIFYIQAYFLINFNMFGQGGLGIKLYNQIKLEPIKTSDSAFLQIFSV